MVGDKRLSTKQYAVGPRRYSLVVRGFSLYAKLFPFTAYDLLLATSCFLPRLEQAPALATDVGLLRWHWRQGKDESGQALPVGGDCLPCGK